MARCVCQIVCRAARRWKVSADRVRALIARNGVWQKRDEMEKPPRSEAALYSDCARDRLSPASSRHALSEKRELQWPCGTSMIASRPLMLSLGGSPLIKAIVVSDEAATMVVVNFCQVREVLTFPLEFVAW